MDINPTTITLAILVITSVVHLVVSIRKPNEKQDVGMARFQEKLKGFSSDMLLIKSNHLPHIENEMKAMSERLARIETILDERLPHKK